MKRCACTMVPYTGINRYMDTCVELYKMAKNAVQLWADSVQLCDVTSIRLLLRVGIKVMDERQISLGYVCGPNIYVRGYLD